MSVVEPSRGNPFLTHQTSQYFPCLLSPIRFVMKGFLWEQSNFTLLEIGRFSSKNLTIKSISKRHNFIDNKWYVKIQLLESLSSHNWMMKMIFMFVNAQFYMYIIIIIFFTLQHIGKYISNANFLCFSHQITLYSVNTGNSDFS